MVCMMIVPRDKSRTRPFKLLVENKVTLKQLLDFPTPPYARPGKAKQTSCIFISEVRVPPNFNKTRRTLRSYLSLSLLVLHLINYRTRKLYYTAVSTAAAARDGLFLDANRVRIHT